MFLEKYKWGQGKNTRLYSALACVVITAAGCWSLYKKLYAGLDISKQSGLWISVAVPLGVFAAITLFLYWLVNRPGLADFLISAEGELKKVSFSTRREIATSTFVVIIVVIFMAIMLGVADLSFSMFFSNVIGI
jgi:preprotein translocase SecE subunit